MIVMQKFLDLFVYLFSLVFDVNNELTLVFSLFIIAFCLISMLKGLLFVK